MIDPHTNETLRRAAAIVTVAIAGVGVVGVLGLGGCSDSLEVPNHPAVFGEDVGTDGEAASAGDANDDGAEASVDSGLDVGTD